jgi:hypothetical protein
MYRIRHAALALILLLLIHGTAHATERLYLIYDEWGEAENDARGISDTDRRDVMRLLCKMVPRDKWPSLTAPVSMPVGKVIDRYFDYFPQGYRATYDELVRQVLAANALPATEPPDQAPIEAGAVIVVPPVPARGVWWTETKRRIRTFSALSQGYNWIPDLQPESIRFTDRRNLRPVEPNCAIGSTKCNEFHNGIVTVIGLESAAALTRAMRELEMPALPGGVVVRTNRPALEVNLLQEQDPCFLPGPGFAQFPQGALLQSRLQSDESLRTTIRENAARVPLVLMDFNFVNGHGAMVYDVVEAVLREAGLLDDLRDYVVTVELDRRAPGASTFLTVIVDQFKEEYGRRGVTPAAQDEMFSAAEAWLKLIPPETASSDRAELPEQVFQALIWKYFADKQSWINVSFFVNAPNWLLQPQSISGSPSFAVIAAGNDTDQPVPVDRYPQAGAKRFDNMINVTFGTRDGRICGSMASKDVPVAVLAPGSGYVGRIVTAAQNGSSLASPYVATISWIKHLLDGVAADTMRGLLTRAVEPTFGVGHSVDSGGYFNPAVVLGFPSEFPKPHMIDANGAVHVLTRGSLFVKYVPFGELNPDFVSVDFANAPSGGLVTVRPCGGDPPRWCIWARRSGRDPQKGGVVHILQFDGGEGSAPVVEASKFAEIVKYLWF